MSTVVDPWPTRWAALADQRAAATVEAQRRVRALLPALAGSLVHHGATRVVLFGSRARGDARLGSDVDLAAAGIPPGEVFRAGAALERLLPWLSIDLVPLEFASAALLAVIAAEGEVLGP